MLLKYIFIFLGSISIYDLPSSTNTSIIEFCSEDNICNDLIVPNDQLDSKEVENWIVERNKKWKE